MFHEHGENGGRDTFFHAKLLTIITTNTELNACLTPCKNDNAKRKKLAQHQCIKELNF